MKTKKMFVFNEMQEAEKIILEGFPNKTIDYGKMYLVAKYLHQKFNYGEIRLEKALIEFCKEQNPSFNPIKEAPAIKKWISSATKYNPREINAVEISQKEINMLKSILDTKEKKLLFATLVLSKAIRKQYEKNTNQEKTEIKNFYIHYSNFSDIIHLSRVSNVSETKLASIFNKHKKLFTFYLPEKELIKLEFVDSNIENVIIITDLENINKQFDYIFKNTKGSLICETCGKEIIKTNNNQKRCKECSREIRREKQRELMRKKRKKAGII